MTADPLRSYRFSTAAQWNACLFDRADRDSPGRGDGLRPFAPFALPPTRFGTAGAQAPVVTRTGEILWRDDAGTLYRLPACADASEASAAPFAIAHASRMIAASNGLWVVGDPPDSLQRYEEDTLSRLLTMEIPDAVVVDIAGNGRDGILALVSRGDVWQSVRVDCAGRIVETVTFEGIAHASAFVYLRRAERFVIWVDAPRPCLHWYPAKGGKPASNITVGAMHPCFTATALGSDGRSRVFVAGTDGETFGGGAYVLTFDAGGNALSDVPLDPLDAPVTGIAATRDSLIVTGPRGLLRFAAAAAVPDAAGEVRCTLITPMLQSPDREDARRWLRIEALASLPEGSTIEMSFAATGDPEVRNRMAAIVADGSLTPSQRVQKLRAEPDLWHAPTVFHGSEPQSDTPFAAPLFDVRERYLWVCITLSAAPGALLPELTELAVLYPGRTLMENLPAIYQRAEESPGSFLRSLVGVLETTTQGLDARIASMGSRVNPSIAPEPWLDFIARWLGLPWDDGFSLDQKKAIMTRAPELANGRGTRAGLEALLESLMPGTPRRFRVTDATADFGFATVGGDGCAGTALPAILGGLTRWSAALDSRAVLGYMRLPCAGQRDDGTWQLAGKVRIDVAASAEERSAWEPWLLTLITEMVPLTARVELRWVSAQALRSDRLDGTLTLEAASAPRLGTDAVTGLARLPARGARLSASGPDIGTPLR
jgi:phage tail-like protein